MADAPTLEDVGHILIYVAPGFFARVAYEARYPQRARDQFNVLVVAVALSVPLVALGNWLADRLDVARDPTDLAYVALLLGVSILAGYGTGAARGWARCRNALAALGYHEQPESMLMARTVLRLPQPDALVTVTLRDGRMLSGTPEFSTSDPDAAVRELYLNHTAWFDPDQGEWLDRRKTGGVLLNLDDVEVIELDDDPK